MKKYDFYIKKSIVKKYRSETFFQKKFYDEFIDYRKKKYQFILNKKNQINQKIKSDQTYLRFESLLKNKVSIKNEKVILIYQKKFEVNLQLKKEYDLKFTKSTNRNTSLCSYIILGILIHRCKSINFIQKLNTILKILDKILIDYKNINRCNYIYLIKLMNIEKKLLNRLDNAN